MKKHSKLNKPSPAVNPGKETEMKNTSAEIKAKIRKLETEIIKEERYSKRWVFLAATINRYNKELGKPAKYTW